MDRHRIIVLGAGVSGLACARELVQRGYQVLVVEARSRVGGRLKGGALELGESCPDTTPGNTNNSNNANDENATATSHPVDLGGALIHGIEKNPIHYITTQMGVPLHTISDHCLLLDENGWPFDPKEDDKISTLFNQCLDITFQRAEQDKESTLSFGELFDKVCQEKGVSPDNPLLKWHQANLELPSGADFHELGYRWNDDEPYGFAGVHAAVQPSWKIVMEKLAEGLDVLHSSPVRQIQIVLPDGTTPSEPPPTTTTITTSAEQQPDVPVSSEQTDENNNGVQEQNSSTLTPPSRKAKPTSLTPTSPTRFSRRIRGEGANVRRSARSNKGIIQMLQIGDAGSLCYDDPTRKFQRRKRKRKEEGETDKESLSSTVQITLQNGTVLEANAVVCTLPLGVLKVPREQPGHVRFAPPLPEPKRKAIEELGCGLLNKCAISFPTVFWQDSDFLGLAGTNHSYLVLNAMKYTQKPILIFMYGGSFAKELESWTDSDIVEDCLGVLKKICGKDVPAPVDYCVTRWGKEQFSRMAFTFIPPGVDGPKQLSTISEVIEDPVRPKKPLIMFAGEHTTPYHPSTMHGAFLSGIREAYRYDLFVEPGLNDNLVFEANEKLYQHTFPTRRVYKNTKSVKATSEGTTPTAAATSEIRSRRRRFAGMALRKLPKKILDTPPPKTPDSSVKSRRSQRSLSVKKPEAVSSTDERTEDEIAQEKKRTIDELEDRTLMRSLESYGRDCKLLRSHIVPVYGATRKRTADQIRSRWQQLMTRKTRSEVWKSWEAKNVIPAPKDYSIEKKGLANTRRSTREMKPRVLIDYI